MINIYKYPMIYKNHSELPNSAPFGAGFSLSFRTTGDDTGSGVSGGPRKVTNCVLARSFLGDGKPWGFFSIKCFLPFYVY